MRYNQGETESTVSFQNSGASKRLENEIQIGAKRRKISFIYSASISIGKFRNSIQIFQSYEGTITMSNNCLHAKNYLSFEKRVDKKHLFCHPKMKG